ncbi:hypothetical protein M0R45_011125 [Rubus argutus]|uniref:Protein kinase domain-containing protein n=1 Tax=Rubus argutus TaxID=59490 RepID=A0AAW1Y9F1_RUBAR
MPPPCFKNPYLKDASQMDIDPYGNQRSKCAAFLPAIKDGNGLSRYHADFHEIEQIGRGNFSHVYKVLNRIDGCLYAVKQSIRQLHQDTERRKALMEVQCLAAIGSHANIVGYYSSWFENEKLYIQTELCDHSLSVTNFSRPFTEGEVLVALYQIAKALQFMHERGVAHLDVKPDNIYVKNGVYKLGDFGCATLLDNSLPIEEGDARYMPPEILNEKHDDLDKADIFSLGVAMYELIKGSPLPVEGPQTLISKKENCHCFLVIHCNFRTYSRSCWIQIQSGGHQLKIWLKIQFSTGSQKCMGIGQPHWELKRLYYSMWILLYQPAQ